MTNLIIGNEFAPKVIPLIKAAKLSIDIIVYEWRWYPNSIGSAIQKFNNVMTIEAKKNKRIRVLTKSDGALRALSQNNIETKKWRSAKNLHTKLMILDKKLVILGSHNYTMNAFTINHEVSVIVEEPEAVQRLNQYFENLWQL